MYGLNVSVVSGLIYGAIVLIWVAILVPMWLRRHDDAVESASPDRMSTAAKVLARRTNAREVGATAADPEPVTEATDRSSTSARMASARTTSTRTTGRLASWSKAAVHGTSRAGVVAWSWVLRPVARWGPWHREAPGAGTSSVRRARRAAPTTARRQRVLAVLVVSTLAITVLAWLKIVPWLAVAPVALLLVGYLVLLRVLVRRHRTAADRRDLPARRTGAAADQLVSDEPNHKLAPAAVRRDHSLVLPLSADLVDASAETTIDLLAGAVPDGFAGPRVGWDPVPVPSPTYVNAPHAPRAVRSIDLSGAGAWTSGRLVADAKAAAAAAVARSGRREESPAARQAVGE